MWMVQCLLTRLFRLFHKHQFSRTVDICHPIWPLLKTYEIEVCVCGASRYKR